MKTILIIKPSSLGDIIHGLLAAESLKVQMPGARIHWVARDIFAPLVRACDTVDHVYEFRRRGGWRPFRALLGEIRQTRFDLVLDMQGLARSAVMARAARADRKIVRGDGREGSRLLIHEKAPLPANYPDSHAVDILLHFLIPLGLRPEPLGKLRFPQNDTAGPFLFSQDAAAGPIVLFPDSRRPEKEWGGFRELTALLLARFPERKIVWAGQGGAAPDPAWADGPFVNLLGKTTLPEMAALIGRAGLVVCNDSGPLHLAAAMRTPVLGIFGPTSPQLYGPYPLTAPTNHVLTAPEGDLTRLDAKTVARAIGGILEKGGQENGN